MSRRLAVRYAELAATTCFSFLEGGSHPEEMVERADELGLEALAIVDRDGLYGVARAHRAVVALERQGRCAPKLLVGARVTLEGSPAGLALIARDRVGYANLCALLTRAHEGRPKGEAALAPQLLPSHAAGLLALLVPPYDDALSAWIHAWLPGCAYVVVHRWRTTGDAPRERQARALSERYALPIVASARPLYHDASRRPLTDVMRCIRARVSLDDAGTLLSANDEAYLRAPAAMERLFGDEPSWVARTADVAERCTLRLDDLGYRFPCLSAREGEPPDDALARLTAQGLERRYQRGAPSAVQAQIVRELAVVRELGVAPYFLSVYDVVEIARERGVLCQGRGSAANSAVCYALGITAVDPARSSTLFERFLSSERGEPPDIDVDFEHERREEVIQAIYGRYGRDHAAMVSEVICFRTRSALREVGLAFGLSADQVDRLSHAGHARREGPGACLAEAGLDAKAPHLLRMIEIADSLQGFPRHMGLHSGGFVLSADPLQHVAPVEPARLEARTVIPWDKDDLDTLGFFKIDVLGLGILTAIRKSFELLGVADPAAALGASHAANDASAASTDALAGFRFEDPIVYDAFCRADTVGVFQIESRAQMAMLPRLRPRCFYDLVVEVALVRPGPIQGGMVHPYLRRRAGEEAVRCPHPALESIVGRTLGVPLFQEQVMAIAIAGAGYSGGEADELRRDMAAWRRNGRLERHRVRLLEGFRARGVDEEFAEALFRQIRGFGEYGFPESHAASFALLVYASGWLKVYHPAAFTCALLNSQPMGFYSPSYLVQDAQRHGVEVRPVSVVDSTWDCTLEQRREAAGRALRLGFRLVRGLGERVAKAIVEARDARSFEGVEDLVHRANVRRRDLEALAEAGALEALAPGRRNALWKARAPRPVGLFAGRPAPERAPSLRALQQVEQMMLDYDRVGLSVDDHPLRHWRAQLAARGVARACDLLVRDHGAHVAVAGLVQTRQRPGTAGGVVFVTLEDETGTSNVVLWDRVFAKHRADVIGASMLLVAGRLERQGSVVHVIARTLRRLGGSGPEPRVISRDFH